MSSHIHIPYEIIIEILTRSPVTSLLRFTRVCKLWYSTITNPKFITTHLNQPHEKSTVQFIFNPFENTVGEKTCQLLNEVDKTYTELAYPSGLKSPINNIYVVGTCNGLICLADGYKEGAKHVIIWNPTIRKSVTLTLPKKQHEELYALLMGFGFVLGKNGYKFVRIIAGPQFSYVEVYEQGGDWRVTECAPPPYCANNIEYFSPPVFMHGALHWLADDTINMIYHNSIIVFDMGDEVFTEIMLPLNIQQHSLFMWITSFDDSLAVISNENWSTQRLVLWVMRDYRVFGSWTKIYAIALPSCLFNPFAFMKSGEILLQNYKDGVQLYDPQTKRCTNIGIQNLVTSFHCFTESLNLLEGEKTVTDQLAHLF